jgi:hypothetical protein
MHVENVVAKGSLVLELRGPDGEIKELLEVPNLVVDVGLAFIASRMKDATATVMSHMAVGTTNTAAADAQTALVAEVAASRTALTSSTIATTNVANDSLTYVCTFGAGVGTGALVEAGIFNAGAAGTMLCRTVFSVITKGALDSLTITWKVVIA